MFSSLNGSSTRKEYSSQYHIVNLDRRVFIALPTWNSFLKPNLVLSISEVFAKNLESKTFPVCFYRFILQVDSPFGSASEVGKVQSLTFVILYSMVFGGCQPKFSSCSKRTVNFALPALGGIRK